MKIRSMLFLLIASSALSACGPIEGTDTDTGEDVFDGAEGALTTTNATVADVDFSSYPAVGLLEVNGPRCVGTLIDEQHVLTLSTCLGHTGTTAEVVNDDPRKAFVIFVESADSIVRKT